MLETHYITAIAVETNKGEYVKKLIPGEPAVAEFVINDEEVLGVYEYCNLHGLWKS
jgi:superoxide reductase